MDYSAFLIPVISALISCFAAVASMYFASKPASVELQTDFDELSLMVEKMAKESRKERMSRVRQSAMPVDLSGKDPDGSNQLPAGSQGRSTKQELRQRALNLGVLK